LCYNATLVDEIFVASWQSKKLKERMGAMAKCQHCGKTTTFGHNRSFSMRATNRKFKANLQKVSVYENGQKVQKLLCTRCIRTLTKTA
jgi:large subunit ribosomal protein L28